MSWRCVDLNNFTAKPWSAFWQWSDLSREVMRKTFGRVRTRWGATISVFCKGHMAKEMKVQSCSCPIEKYTRVLYKCFSGLSSQEKLYSLDVVKQKCTGGEGWAESESVALTGWTVRVSAVVNARSSVVKSLKQFQFVKHSFRWRAFIQKDVRMAIWYLRISLAIKSGTFHQ